MSGRPISVSVTMYLRSHILYILNIPIAIYSIYHKNDALTVDQRKVNLIGRRYQRILCPLNITETGRSMGSLCEAKITKQVVSSKNQKPSSPGISKLYLGEV